MSSSITEVDTSDAPPPSRPPRRKPSNKNEDGDRHRHSSISTEICDLIDSNKKFNKKSSYKGSLKMRMPWNSAKDLVETENDGFQV